MKYRELIINVLVEFHKVISSMNATNIGRFKFREQILNMFTAPAFTIQNSLARNNFYRNVHLFAEITN